MKTNNMNIRFEGVAVQQSFLPNEAHVASEAKFILENKLSQPVKVDIKNVFFVDGNKKENIEKYHLYANDNELNNHFTLKENTSLKFRITFPNRNIHIKVGNNFELGVSALINGKEFNTNSKLNFVVEDKL
jgi:hypothetical protein